MGKAFLAIVAAAWASVAMAQAPADVSLRTGESAVVRIAADGAVTVESRGAAAPTSAFEEHALHQMVATQVPEGTGVVPPVAITGAKAPAMAAGRIRVTLREVTGKTPRDALLSYDRGFRYRAVMRRGERSAPTDVCLVMAGKPGFEHWPFQLDSVDLADLRLVPWKDGDPLPCA